MPVRTIATELTLGGEREFQDAMKGVNSNLKTLDAEMKAVASSFIGQEQSTKALTAANKQLQQIQEQQAAKIDALKRRYEALESATVKDTGAIDKARTAYLNATTQYNKTAAEIKKNEDQIKANTDAVIAAAEAEEAEAKALEAARKEKEKYIPVTERAGKAAETFKNKVSESAAKTREAARHVPVLGESIDILGKTVPAVAKGTVKSFSAIAKAAAGLTTVGVAAVGGMAAVGAAALETLTGFATDAATRSKEAYDKAHELNQKSLEAALAGNEEAALEYDRQANELMASIDETYLALGNSLDTLSQSSTAAKDAMGKILLPALQDLSDEGAALLQSFADDMNAAAGDTEKMGQIMAEYLQAGIELLREKIPAFGAIAVDLLEGLGAGLQENLPGMLDDILAIVDYILTTIEDHADELGGAAAALISTLLGFLIDHAPDLLGAGGELIGAIVQGLANNLPTLLAKIPEMVSSLLDTLVTNAPEMLAGGAELIGQILAGLAQAIPDLLAEIISLPGKLFDSFTNANIDWGSIGSNIVAGISQGFSQMWNDFVNSVTGAFDNLVNSVSGFLGIASPSKLFRDRIGKNMAAGVDVGFETEMQNVSRDMQRSLDDAMPEAGPLSFNSSVSGGGSVDGSGGSVTNMGGFTIIINGYNVQNDEELAEKISYALQDLLDRKGA